MATPLGGGRLEGGFTGTENQMSETFGERLRRLRTAAGLTQEQVAEGAGVPLTSLRNWERDRREPSVTTGAALARALGVSADELLGMGAGQAAADPGAATPPPEPPAPAKRGRPAKPRAGEAQPPPGAGEGKAKKGKRTEE